MGMFENTNLKVALTAVAIVATTPLVNSPSLPHDPLPLNEVLGRLKIPTNPEQREKPSPSPVSLTDNELQLIGTGSDKSQAQGDASTQLSKTPSLDELLRMFETTKSRETSEAITLKMLNTDLDPEEGRGKFIKELETKLGGKLGIQIEASESFAAFEKRAEERVKNIFAIRSVVPVSEKPWLLNPAEGESLDSFASRVLGKALAQGEKRITDNRAVTRSLNAEIIHDRCDNIAKKLEDNEELSLDQRKTEFTRALFKSDWERTSQDLKLEKPTTEESFEDFRKRAEQRAVVNAELWNMDETARRQAGENFQGFSDRVTLKFFQKEQAYQARIQALVKELGNGNSK